MRSPHCISTNPRASIIESWIEGLEYRGTIYYEGWVENTERVLTAHIKVTVTCYGTRRSSRNSSSAPGHSSGTDKENAAPIKPQMEKGTKVLQICDPPRGTKHNALDINLR